MSEQKHTPGPWILVPERWGRGGSYDEPRIFGSRRNAVGERVCVATVRVGVEETEANGNLMAAAPDLLEAAKGMQCACSLDSGHLLECGMPNLLEAIAKAEGRS